MKCLYLQKSQFKQKSCKSHCTLCLRPIKTDVQKEKKNLELSLNALGFSFPM